MPTLKTKVFCLFVVLMLVVASTAEAKKPGKPKATQSTSDTKAVDTETVTTEVNKAKVVDKRKAAKNGTTTSTKPKSTKPKSTKPKSAKPKESSPKTSVPKVDEVLRPDFSDPTSNVQNKRVLTSAEAAAPKVRFQPLTGKYLAYGTPTIVLSEGAVLYLSYPTERFFTTQTTGQFGNNTVKGYVAFYKKRSARKGTRIELVPLGEGFVGASIVSRVSSTIQFGTDKQVIQVVVENGKNSKRKALKIAKAIVRELAETTPPGTAPAII
jgi:hypothetical protein